MFTCPHCFTHKLQYSKIIQTQVYILGECVLHKSGWQKWLLCLFSRFLAQLTLEKFSSAVTIPSLGSPKGQNIAFWNFAAVTCLKKKSLKLTAPMLVTIFQRSISFLGNIMNNHRATFIIGKITIINIWLVLYTKICNVMQLYWSVLLGGWRSGGWGWWRLRWWPGRYWHRPLDGWAREWK